MPSPSWPQHFSPEVVRRSFGGGILSAYCLALEAWRRGLTVTFLDGELRRYTISDDSRRVTFDDSRPVTITRPADYQRLIRKWDTKRLLEEAAVPVPRGHLLAAAETSLEDLKRLADTLGYPLVIKPNNGTMGQGVFSGLKSWDELSGAWEHLVNELKAEQVLIEQHYEGDDYRILVVGDRVLAACLRIPANVVGDGTSTVQQLIDEKNAQRAENPFLSKGVIRVDYEVREELAAQSLALSDVPEADRHVALRRIANASAGGDVVDVTEELPEPIRQAAIDAVAATPNVVIAGVDVLYRTGQPATPETFTVIEMNSRPHIPVNMYPTEGVGQDVPRGMLDYFFPESPRTDLPLDEMLNFDPRPFKAALRLNVVDSMTVKPLPSHHFPTRVVYRFSGGIEILPVTVTQRRRLQKLAKAQIVAGSLERRGKDLQLLIGTESSEAAQRFVEETAQLLSLPVPQGQEWTGPLTAGFRISQTLQRTPETANQEQSELKTDSPGKI